jgi:hypothetical protein
MSIPRGNTFLAGLKFTREERQRIIGALKNLCLAKAAYWDALRAVETRAGNIEVDTTDELESFLAGNCDVPANWEDLPNREVWRAFLENAHVETYEVQR